MWTDTSCRKDTFKHRVIAPAVIQTQQMRVCVFAECNQRAMLKGRAQCNTFGINSSGNRIPNPVHVPSGLQAYVSPQARAGRG